VLGLILAVDVLANHRWERGVHYTYVIESIHRAGKRYIGHTADLKQRLATLNAGGCKFTSKHRPWRIRAYFAFQEIETARDFERYLKSGSGHAFAKKHFWPGG
jgi:predicted GIY-YIG superfamily endonuclease